MRSRLIAIACLVFSLLMASSVAWAEYRSDHEGVRAGPRPSSSAGRRPSLARDARNAEPSRSRVEARPQRTSRLPKLLLVGVVAGGAWFAYRKYGRQLSSAQLARVGGVAALGLGIVYVLLSGRSGQREVAATGSARPAVGASRQGRSESYPPNDTRYREAHDNRSDDSQADDAQQGYAAGRPTTRRERLSDSRRGPRYDHSTRNAPATPEPVAEPVIPDDPALIEAISNTGRAKPPALFDGGSARPMESATATSPAGKRGAEAVAISPEVRSTGGRGTTKSTAASAPISSSTPGNTTAANSPAGVIATAADTATASKPVAKAAQSPGGAKATAATKAKSATKVAAAPAVSTHDRSGGGTASATASAERAIRPQPATPREAPAAPVAPAHYQSTSESGSSGAGGTSSGGSSTADGSTPQSGQTGTIGIAPPKEIPEFLRQESVLLDPGEYQIEVGFLYTLTQSSSVLQLGTGDATLVGDLERRQRLMLTNVDLRVGITPNLQGSVLIPFGWSSGETVFAGQDQVSSSGGIGDINLGLTRLIREGDMNSSQILMNLGMSAPTGESNFVSSVSAPGSQLGQGFYTMTAGLTFVRVFDPLVMFGGFGVQHRFDTEVAPGVTLSPGELVYYRFGLGWAVNTRVTLNGSFSGSYLTDIELNSRRIAGSAREPMSIRLAATIARAKRHSEVKPKMRTVEPHVQFGLTDSAPAVQMGISWSY